MVADGLKPFFMEALLKMEAENRTVPFLRECMVDPDCGRGLDWPSPPPPHQPPWPLQCE